jgi:DNA gyrase subunit B
MDPEQRKMYRVAVEDAQQADEIFKILMWGDVPPRRRFIQSRAKDVKNLDV